MSLRNIYFISVIYKKAYRRTDIKCIPFTISYEMYCDRIFQQQIRNKH